MENGYASVRYLEKCCRTDIRYMGLLGGMKAPSFMTFENFIKEELTERIEEIFLAINRVVFELEGVDLEHTSIDGTKIEANANKYTFVWKKGTEKQREKLNAKVAEQLPGLLANAGIKYRLPEAVAVRHLKKIRKKLYAQKQAEGI